VRTLTRKLRLPKIEDVPVEDSAFAMYLPRRGTRRLFTALAVMVGIGAGALYGHFFLAREGTLWTVAAGAVGAFLGFVLILMPGVLVQFLRKTFYNFSLSRHASDLSALLTRASRRLAEATEENPEDAATWSALGVAELLRDEHQRAASCLERASELSNGQAPASTNLAAALTQTREFDRAAQLLIEAAQSEEAGDAARHNLGVLLSRQPPVGIVDRVLANVEALSSPDMLNSLGIFEMTRGAYELAEDYFTKACEVNPAGVAPRANLAVVAHRRGDLEHALATMRDAEVLDPLNPAVHNDLAVLLCAANQPMAAVRELTRASFLAPGSSAVELNRGCVRLVLGHYRDALDSFANPTLRDDYPIEAAHNTALALIGQERHEPALEELEGALTLVPDDADMHTNAGCIAWVLGDDARMAAELDRAATTASDEVATTTNIATARILKGKAEEAVAMLERLSERRRKDPAVTFHLGLAYLADALRSYHPEMSRTQRQDFFRSLHRAVRPLDAVSADTSQCSYEALANLGLYRYLRQQYDEAVDAFEGVAKAYPEDGYLQFAIGTCLAEHGMTVQAGHQAAGDELVGQARELLVRARRHLSRAAELEEASADLYCNLGMVAYNLSDVEAARQAFRKMLQIEGGDDAANNLAIVYAKEASKMQADARAAGLVSEDRQHNIVEDMRTAISTALHYFHKALELDRDNPVLHGNIGLAYMIRNRESDVESALRHWQHMRRLGGAAQARRYEELTAMVDAKAGTRAAFDETLMGFRPLDPLRALTAPPPSLSGARFVMQPIVEEHDWMLFTEDPEVRRALRLRERVIGLKARLARMSI